MNLHPFWIAVAGVMLLTTPAFAEIPDAPTISIGSSAQVDKKYMRDADAYFDGEAGTAVVISATSPCAAGIVVGTLKADIEDWHDPFETKLTDGLPLERSGQTLRVRVPLDVTQRYAIVVEYPMNHLGECEDIPLTIGVEEATRWNVRPIGSIHADLGYGFINRLDDLHGLVAASGSLGVAFHEKSGVRAVISATQPIFIGETGPFAPTLFGGLGGFLGARNKDNDFTADFGLSVGLAASPLLRDDVAFGARLECTAFDSPNLHMAVEVHVYNLYDTPDVIFAAGIGF